MPPSSTPSKMKQLFKQFTLLYIEDNVTLLENTGELFQLLFKESFTAKDGFAALDIYNDYFDKNDTYIDIVISDIEMPLMNGIEVSKKLLEYNKNQKVIITSGYDDKKYFIDLIKIGVDGFIEKPLRSEHINTVLYDVCKKLSEERALQREILFSESCKFQFGTNTLIKEDIKISLSEAETKCLLLLLSDNKKTTYTTLEIFDYIYPFDKEFSQDTIKGLLKRLRKKLPQETIKNIPNRGYYINTL